MHIIFAVMVPIPFVTSSMIMRICCMIMVVFMVVIVVFTLHQQRLNPTQFTDGNLAVSRYGD
ncbi:hypothetical protein D3C75_1190350 [compost metagenome]